MAMEIFTVGRGQEGYPERLMPFADMPSRLFVRGALPADEQKTAARNAFCQPLCAGKGLFQRYLQRSIYAHRENRNRQWQRRYR